MLAEAQERPEAQRLNFDVEPAREARAAPPKSSLNTWLLAALFCGTSALAK